MNIKFINLPKIDKFKEFFAKNDDNEYNFICGKDDVDLDSGYISVDTAYTFNKKRKVDLDVKLPVLEFNPNHNYLADF